MAKNRYSSPIIISDEDTNSSSTESDSTIESNPDYWGPENQLGLESRNYLATDRTTTRYPRTKKVRLSIMK